MQKEPKDCMVVTLRSGKELDERRVERKNIEEEKQVEIGENMSRIVQKLQRRRSEHNCIPSSREGRKE